MTYYIVRESGYPGKIEQENLGELIRCKECIYYQKHSDRIKAQKFRKTTGVCKMHNYDQVIADEDYCSKGVKR